MTRNQLFRFVVLLASVTACGLTARSAACQTVDRGARGVPWVVTIPEVVLRGVPFTVTVVDTGSRKNEATPAATTITVGDQPTVPVELVDGTCSLPENRLDRGGAEIIVQGAAGRIAVQPRVLPGWLAVVPPVLAIALALVTRQVVLALLLGIWIGVMILYDWNPLVAFLRLGDRFLVDALADRSHASILIFSTILGGMVGVLARGGATKGMVRFLAARVGGRRGGQVATAAMGTLIFFDDYANTLLVGSTMRPLTDTFRISREKLAYLVDSTAAPIATIAVISTWVGFEVGLIQDAMARLDAGGSAYTFFLRSLPYGFYPILTMMFVYFVAGSGRDFGPMLRAERRALLRGELIRPGSRPASDLTETDAVYGGTAHEARALPAGLGLLPVLLVIGVTAVGLIWNGRNSALAAGLTAPSVREILNHADSFSVLIWAALAGAVCAIALTVGLKRLSAQQAIDGWVEGAKAMLIAMTILMLAWALSAVCSSLQTAEFLVALCSDVLSAHLLPVVTFLLAAAISFATGTSWGTMAILVPLVYPLGVALPAAAGLAGGSAEGIHLAAVSAVLAGAVFGDHCSPISDTTILSSLASGSDHVDHVRTQLPYAVTAAVVAIATGYLPAGFGVSPWLSILLGGVLLAGLVFWRGRRVEEP